MYAAERLNNHSYGPSEAIEFRHTLRVAIPIPSEAIQPPAANVLPFNRDLKYVYIMGIQVRADKYPLPSSPVTYEGINTATPSMIAARERRNLSFIG